MRTVLWLLLLVPGFAGISESQPEEASSELVPLHVQLVVTQHRGGPDTAELSRLTHNLQVVANSRTSTTGKEGRCR